MASSTRKKSFACPVYAPRACPLCDAIDDALRGRGPFQLVRREAGSTLLRHGSEVQHICQVRSGSIKLSVADASGAERASTMRGAGAFIGMEAMLGLAAMLDAHVHAEATLAVIKRSAFERWMEETRVPTVALVKHFVAEQARVTAERLLVDGTSEARTARFVLERTSNPYLSAWRDAPRHEVAGLLSMRPETFSRAVRVLQDRGAVGPDLEIIDAQQLRRIAKENGSSGA